MNAQATESATQILLNSGLPGVCILGLTAAVVFLMRANVKLQEKRDEEHERRLADQQANTRVLLEAHDRLHDDLEVVDKLGERMQRATEVLERQSRP